MRLIGLRDIKLYLIDIKEAINKIQSYTKEINFKEFSNNNEKVDAVIRNFEVIGEAAKHIPDEIKDDYKDIGWIDITGMRNILTHQYFGIDLNIIWKTIKEKLPELKTKIEEIISSIDKKSNSEGAKHEDL